MAFEKIFADFVASGGTFADCIAYFGVDKAICRIPTQQLESGATLPLTRLKCPNCFGNVANHQENGCILGAMIRVISEHGTMSEKTLRTLHAKVDVNALWEDIGRVIDKLEDGTYSDK